MCEMNEEMMNMQKQVDVLNRKMDALLGYLKLAVHYEPESFEVIKESEAEKEMPVAMGR